MKKIGIWVRVSDPKQVAKDGHIHHEILAQKFAESREWKVVKVYRLEAMTGKSVMEYSQTKQMLYDVQTGVISGLVFAKIARLARNTKELIEIAEVFRDVDADLVSMDMAIDTSTPLGRHFYRQMGSMAEWERETIVDRINTSVKVRADLGKRLGGHAPYGYQYIDKKLALDPEESVVCKLVYGLFLKNKRKRTTAKILNERGYRTKRDKLFTYAQIARILTDPVYKGLHRMNYTTTDSTGKKKILKPKEDWRFHKVEAIVTEDIWNSVQAIIKTQLKSRKQPLNGKVRLFTNFAFCHCGGKMVNRNSSMNYICKNKCGNKIHREDLEEIFKSELQAYTLSKPKIEEYSQQIEGIVSEKRQQLNILKKEEIKVNTQIQKLLDLYNEDQIEKDAFRSYHEKPYQRLQQIYEAIAELEGEVMGCKNQEEMTQIVFKEAQTLYTKWDSLTHSERRNIIETLTDKIIIGEQDITINLYKIAPDVLIPNSLELTANGCYSQSFVNRFS